MRKESKFRSIQLARKHCKDPSWIYIDTTPFYAMVRFSGSWSGHKRHFSNAELFQIKLIIWMITTILVQDQRWASPFLSLPSFPSSLLQSPVALPFLVRIIFLYSWLVSSSMKSHHCHSWDDQTFSRNLNCHWCYRCQPWFGSVVFCNTSDYTQVDNHHNWLWHAIIPFRIFWS